MKRVYVVVGGFLAIYGFWLAVGGVMLVRWLIGGSV